MVRGRTCIVCRNKDIKENLIRIVSYKNGNTMYDREQKVNSRAIYLCKNKKCLESIKKYILKNKFKSKVYINNESFVKLIDELEIEVGE